MSNKANKGKLLKHTAITDASFCPETNAGGWAVWIVGKEGRFKSSGAFKDKVGSSSLAELKALLIAMHYLKKIGAKNILLQSDCQSALDTLSKAVKRKDKDFLDVDISFHDVLILRHIKGHSGKQDRRSYVNRWCDKKARGEMRKKRDELK